ncbi:NAD(P)/FAD-dependent oxidoreductase [Myxosarcina sp. GI1]|uniref:NAD(P)/FAD-dependent oxidoreductase n=1 Tax=Myxosarcina sp. GI1 TaxID=1541065 RepID=UPI000563CABA|nr:FAD-dependent oxidoreductase [Myxosarcina sp. GI1]
MKLYDVAIVGAGMAGLTCARQLQQQGYRVIVLEKSRGVGGRVTTRRVGDRLTIDRGLPWLEVQGEQTQKLIEQLQQEAIIEPWNGRVYRLNRQGKIQPTEAKNRYVAPQGINAIAKYIARDLAIAKQCRITSVRYKDNAWQLISKTDSISAKAMVIAVPAPQAVDILKGIELDVSAEFTNQLQAVKYYPCITVSAGYEPCYFSDLPPWEVLNFDCSETIAKIIFDSRKKNNDLQPVFIFHSTPQFADKYLEETDLQPIGEQLLAEAAILQCTWFKSTQWMQVHRWRYAISRDWLDRSCLVTKSPLPLVCCGDWCSGKNLESALVSGLESAEAIANKVADNN